MNNYSEITLRRQNSFCPNFLPDSTTSLNSKTLSLIPEESRNVVLAATVAKNMESLGYIPSAEMFEAMIKDEALVGKVQDYIIPTLRELKGADINYNPMYPNFPQQVMDMSNAELYTNAIIHYLSYGKWHPLTNEDLRKELSETVKLTTIKICDEAAVKGIFTNLLNSSTPWSDKDKSDISAFLDKYSAQKHMPNFMVNRENMATLADIVMKKEGPLALFDFKNQIKSVTDVLRIMNMRHGNGDPTLKNEKLHITKISRPERKMYLSLINNCKNAAEDMKINRTTWVKIGQGLHPGEYKTKYPKAFDAFNSMRSNELVKDVKTYNAKVEHSITSGNINLLKQSFSEKPGAFARNLDRIIRESENPTQVLSLWNELAPKVDPNLLWQVRSHFERRMAEEERLRIFVVANKNARTVVKEDTTKPISAETCKDVIFICEKALKEQYKDKPAMGKIFIDPEIAQCKIPNGTRGAQSGLAKGSRMPLNRNANVTRAFIWWTNLPKTSPYGNDRVDVDLSAAMLDKNLNVIDRVSYYNLKPTGDYAFHSGDIVDGGDFNKAGVAEFVDIDIDKAKSMNIKYVCFTVNSFSEQTFGEMEHCRFGWMERENSRDGQIFEPATVKQSFNLTANSRSALMCMFDLESREMIWMDEIGQDSFRSSSQSNNLDANIKGSTMSCYKTLHLEKPNISDVIRLNAEARGGEIVYDRKDADLVFSLDGDVTPMSSEFFSGELLPREVSPEFIKAEEEQETLKENPSLDDVDYEY